MLKNFFDKAQIFNYLEKNVKKFKSLKIENMPMSCKKLKTASRLIISSFTTH